MACDKGPGVVGLAAFAALALGVPATADAQIFGAGARTEFVTGFGVRTVIGLARAADLLDDGMPVVDPSERVADTRFASIAVVYGLHRRVSLIATLPLPDPRLRLGAGVSAERLGSGLGLGDLTLLAKWRLFKVDRGRGSLQLAVQGGVRTPSGRHRARDATGRRLPAGLQRGGGAWSPTVDLIGSYSAPSARWFLGASVGATFPGAAEPLESGNQVRYDAMVKLRLSSLRARDAFLVLELNGARQSRSRLGGVELGDSGGHLLFVSPGIQYLVRPNVIMEAGVQLPVVRHLNGRQLAPTINLLVGVRYIVSR